jgi:tagaturonate reductase
VSKIIHAYQEWEDFLMTAREPGIKYLFSNTTESGLRLTNDEVLTDTPPPSFPAKLCCWLYERFQHFDGSPDSGCIIIPCELVEDNGHLLRQLVMECAEQWQLELDFIRWLVKSNVFCNTLVDRIIPGVSQDKLPSVWKELGYEDRLVTEGEPYHIFVIEGPKEVGEKLPLDQVGLNVVFTEDSTPFRERKVKILNGSHTALVPVAYLSGLRIVRDTVDHPLLRQFLDRLLKEEILAALDMPKAELREYAESVVDRFKNPYIDHYWLTISLNSFAKWKVRLLPSLLSYVAQHGKAPVLMSFSLACLIRFYKGSYAGEEIALNDEARVMEYLQEAWQAGEAPAIAEKVLSWSGHWGQDLTAVPDLLAQVTDYLGRLEKEDVPAILQSLLK